MSKDSWLFNVVAPLAVVGLIVAVFGGAQMAYLANHRPAIEHSKAEERVLASLKPHAFLTLNFGSGKGMCVRFLRYERQSDTDLLMLTDIPNLGVTKVPAYGDPQELVAAGCSTASLKKYYEDVEIERQYEAGEKRLARYTAFFAHLHPGDRFTVNYDGSKDFCQTFLGVNKDSDTGYLFVTSKLDGTDRVEDMYSGGEASVRAGCSSKQPT